MYQPTSDQGEIGTVYLLCFERPFHHARHYVGWARNVEARVKHHKNGSGAKLTAAVAAAGIEMTVVRTWEGATRNFERSLHNRHGSKSLCPVCSGK